MKRRAFELGSVVWIVVVLGGAGQAAEVASEGVMTAGVGKGGASGAEAIRSRSTGVLSYEAGQVAKMADAGVTEGVLMAYVEGSVYVTPVRADEIIYLTEHKVPATVVTSLIRRGAELSVAATTVTRLPNEAAGSAITPATSVATGVVTGRAYPSYVSMAYAPSYGYAYPAAHAVDYPTYSWPVHSSGWFDDSCFPCWIGWRGPACGRVSFGWGYGSRAPRSFYGGALGWHRGVRVGVEFVHGPGGRVWVGGGGGRPGPMPGPHGGIGGRMRGPTMVAHGGMGGGRRGR